MANYKTIYNEKKIFNTNNYGNIILISFKILFKRGL